MVDLTDCCKKIQHARDKDKTIEQANCKAILFDQNDGGFVKHLVENYGSGHVDYIELIESGLILIELKDLMERLMHKNVDDILENLDKKYNNSINIVKKHIDQHCIPVLYYIVIKNNTDIVALDNIFPIRTIKKKFNSKGQFKVCKTEEICAYLQEFDTRLCQE